MRQLTKEAIIGECIGRSYTCGHGVVIGHSSHSRIVNSRNVNSRRHIKTNRKTG